MRENNSVMWLGLGAIVLYLIYRTQSAAPPVTIMATPSGNLAIPVPGEVNGPPPQYPTYSPGPGMVWQISPSWPSLPSGQQYIAVPAS